MTKLTRGFLLAAVALAATGCFNRYLLDVEDGPAEGNRTTILYTFDHQNNLIFQTGKWVYWECEEQGDKLICDQKCDIKDDQGDILTCQKVTAFIL